MSEYRDRLSPEQQDAFDRAIQGAAHVFASAREELDAIAAQGGAEAVAQWAHPAGTQEQKAALAAYYRRLCNEAADSATEER
jgi:hypothetical protein